MSISVALNTAVSGLFANQQAIAATSENIANVNTENFTRREVTFSTDAIPGQFAGVDVEITRAAVDRFLQSTSYSAAADAGRSSVVAEAIARVEASLGAPGDNLSFANELDEAFAAFALLSADPTSVSARTSALAALDAAFDAFARTGGAIDDEIAASDGRLSVQTARANALLKEIFDLNQLVGESASAGDAIDTRLRELSTLVDIAVTRSDDGQVSISTLSGQSLASGGGYSAFAVTGGTSATVTLSTVDTTTGAVTGSAVDVTNAITGGEIGGLIALRNTELPSLAAIVDTVAADVAAAINAAYAGNTETGAVATATNLLIVSDGGRLTVNPTLLDNPQSLAIARPTAGAVGGINDGAGAIAIADIAGTVAVRNAAQAVTQIGAASRIAEDARIAASAFDTEIRARTAANSGVNLDEELSNLILYQRAYGANARIIAAVDQLYQSLLDLI